MVLARVCGQRIWPWLLCAAFGCAQKPPEARAVLDSSASGESGRRSTFLWSLPVTVSPAARALSEQGKSETELAGIVAVGFRTQSGEVPGLRQRYPDLQASGGSPASVTIAPFVERPQVVAQPKLEATFVIDHDQPSVRELLGTVPSEERTPQGLEAFVARTLDASSGRRFDIASRVATLKKGDCTEHAVLLTALLRASGQSARVVLGVVVLLGPGIAEAAGHAWVEVDEAGHWRRLDAALHQDGAGARMARLYLSTDLLDDEGPSYGTGLLEDALARTPLELTVDRWSGP